MTWTDEEIRRLLAVCEAATPGPWEVSRGVYYDPDPDGEPADCYFGRGPTRIPQSIEQGTADARYIAASRDPVHGWEASLVRLRAALGEVRRLRAVLQSMIDDGCTYEHPDGACIDADPADPAKWCWSCRAYAALYGTDGDEEVSP